MMRGRISVALACFVAGAFAVDRSKFRTCQQGSFCRRFKAWAQRSGLQDPLWTVLPESKQAVSAGFSYKVKHVHEAAPHLLLQLDFHSSGVIRLRLNEIDPQAVRHVIPPGDAVHDPLPPSAKVVDASTPQSTTFTFTTDLGAVVKATLKHAPLALEVVVDGVVVQRINSRNLLNFERYREVAARHSTLRPPDANANDASVTIDAAAHPGVDTNSLWEEDFGGHTDKKPRGPASVGMDVSFEGEVPSLFGLPEHATNARLPFYEEPYRFFNLDVFEYEINDPMALYGAVPILWGVHRASGRNVASGFLWINPSETFVKLERNQGAEAGTGPAHAWWTSESGVIDVAVLVGPTPTQVSAQFHALTGPAPIPPLWALGKHQCRWNYMSEKDVATVDGSYDKHDLPYDVIWLDIEHTNGKKYFTWNEANFPTPDKMIQKISDKKRKFVNVVDPHIKKDTDFHIWKEISEAGLFVKKVDWKNKDDPTDTKPEVWVEIKEIPDPNATVPDIWNVEEDGIYEPPKIANPEYTGDWKARQILDYDSPKSDFEGWCWPGTSMYPDFTDPKMREYWGAQFALDKYKGTNADTYIWNDMNEPSVFNGPEVTMPRDALHGYGNVEHRDVHNMYGYYVHRASFEGLAKRTPGDRPFVLTRSFFIGSHKYSAIWTGDNYAKWEHLKASIAMVGALTLGGQSLVGADVGGFFKHPDSEMMVRWYQLGVLAYPFLRNHAHLETPRREPFTLDETNMNRLKATLQMRYQMLPYWYTLFEEYHRLGSPVVRPLFWDFLDDLATHDDETATESEIMLGDSVLVYGVTAPITDSYKEASVYLPKAAGWFDLHDGTFFASGRHTVPLSIEHIPAYYRAGSIIPLKKRVRRSSSCMAFDPLTLLVHLDPATGKANGRLYVDDYKTKDYLQGKSLKVEFEFANGVLKASKVTGQLPETITAEVERVQIFGLTKSPVGATLEVDGKSVELTAPVVTATGPYSTATLKIAPWIDLRKGNWALKVA